MAYFPSGFSFNTGGLQMKQIPQVLWWIGGGKVQDNTGHRHCWRLQESCLIQGGLGLCWLTQSPEI